MGINRAAVVGLWAFAALLASAIMSPGNAGTFVYVGNADSNDINVFALDAKSGDLTAIEKVAVPGVAKAGPTTPMAVTSDKRLLFIGIRSEPQFAATFAIDPKTGKLTHRGNGPLADSMAYISVDRSGRYLLSASYPGHRLTVNAIGPQGVVEAPKQFIPDVPNAHAILADAGNRFVLASSLGSDTVRQYRFDAATGTLSANDPPAVKVKDKAGPRHFVFHPNGKLVYLVCELDATVHVFDYDPATGRLAEKQSVSALQSGYDGKVWAADLHLTPNGKFLYASERGTSMLAGFKVDGTNGTLAPIGFFATEKQPRGFNIDSSGRYLLPVGQLSNGLSSYTIDADTGKLAKLKEYPVGENPNWVEIVDLP
jgi:6-phosphogluconolactonase